MEIVLFFPILIGLVACLCSSNFVYRIIGLKICGDGLAVFTLSLNGSVGAFDMSLVALVTLSLTTALVMMVAVVGERELGENEK